MCLSVLIMWRRCRFYIHKLETKTEGKRLVERPRHRWAVKMDLQETDVDWTQLTQTNLFSSSF